MLVRLAEQEDCDEILEWRNDDVTRSMSYDGAIVDYPAHKGWFDKSLENKQRVLVVGVEGENKVGVVRYDNDGAEIEVSINLNPKIRGKSFGQKLLTKSESFIPPNWRMLKLLAEIKEENIASIKTFERSGYTFIENNIRDGHNVCIYNKEIL